MARKPRKNVADDLIVQELTDIKRLMILQLMTSGLVAAQIAKALQIDRSAISRLVPAAAAKRSSRR